MAGLDHISVILDEILSIKKEHPEVFEEYFYDLEDEVDAMIEELERNIAQVNK